jgi:hypothetical protein
MYAFSNFKDDGCITVSAWPVNNFFLKVIKAFKFKFELQASTSTLFPSHEETTNVSALNLPHRTISMDFTGRVLGQKELVIKSRVDIAM